MLTSIDIAIEKRLCALDLHCHYGRQKSKGIALLVSGPLIQTENICLVKGPNQFLWEKQKRLRCNSPMGQINQSFVLSFVAQE